MKKEQIKEINQHISDALKQWADIAIMSEADGWAVRLDYSDEDLLNALYIFNHVAQNIAIKNDYYKDDKDIIDKMSKFKDGIKIGYGFDTVELTNKVLNNGKEKILDEYE